MKRIILTLIAVFAFATAFSQDVNLGNIVHFNAPAFLKQLNEEGVASVARTAFGNKPSAEKLAKSNLSTYHFSLGEIVLGMTPKGICSLMGMTFL